MKFTIITHTIHKQNKNFIYGYEPYIREMNLWIKNAIEVQVVCPISSNEITKIETAYTHKKIEISKIPSIDVKTLINSLKTISKLPIILLKIYKAMRWADHIHLRCPGNIGLLGSLIQILFPSKPKTVKYAGNWNPKSKQPFSYKLQKWIVSNTFLTKNCKVLVYGKWENQSKNIIPFFTATYTESDKKFIEIRKTNSKIEFVFVGSLTEGKRPLLAIKIVEQLQKEGCLVSLKLYGEGEMRGILEKYITDKNLQSDVVLKGNQNQKTIKETLQKVHFLLLPSKSEGWPKVVAEAMFWACLPIVTKISCVPYMLQAGKRGVLIESELYLAVKEIKKYIENNDLYQQSCENAITWSRNYTLNKFEAAIAKLVQP